MAIATFSISGGAMNVLEGIKELALVLSHTLDSFDWRAILSIVVAKQSSQP